MTDRFSLTRLLFSAPCKSSARVMEDIAMRLALALKVESTSTGRRFNT